MKKEKKTDVAVHWRTPTKKLGVRMYAVADKYHTQEKKIRYFNTFYHAAKCIKKLYIEPVFCGKTIDLTQRLDNIHELKTT